MDSLHFGKCPGSISSELEANPYDIPLNPDWFNRDPYIGLCTNSPHNWVGSHPLYQTTNQGPFFHGSSGLGPSKFRFVNPQPGGNLIPITGPLREHLEG